MKKKNKIQQNTDFESKLLYTSLREEIKKYLSYPIEKQRLLYFTDKINKKETWVSVSFAQSDEFLIYSERTYELKMTTHLYPQIKVKKGFTFNKKTNKLSMWYMSQPKDLFKLGDLLKELGKEWVVNEKLTRWLTKSLLEKILSGKITNPSDCCKQIIKLNRMKGASPEHLRQYIKKELPKPLLLYMMDVVTDINQAMSEEFHDGNTTARDIIKQAKALGRKVNLSWSPKRMNEVHSQWSDEIMAEEINQMDEVIIPYNFSPLLPSDIKLIKTKKELFKEGSRMHHCVYTNYWSSIISGQYMVFSVERNGEKATLGVTQNRYKPQKGNNYQRWCIDQFKGIRNSTPSLSLSEYTFNVINDKFLESLPIDNIVNHNAHDPIHVFNLIENPPYQLF